MSKDKMKLGDNFAVIDERVYVAIRREDLEQLQEIAKRATYLMDNKVNTLRVYDEDENVKYIVNTDRDSYNNLYGCISVLDQTLSALVR